MPMKKDAEAARARSPCFLGRNRPMPRNLALTIALLLSAVAAPHLQRR